MIKTSEKTQPLVQSGIRSASIQCAAVNGINLGQGVCDLPIVAEIKQAAYKAIEENKSLYSPCEGIFLLREKIAEKIANFNKISVDPKEEVIVTHGSTGAFVCAVATLFNPGDEVILFEPYYGYHQSILALYGIKVVTVAMNLADFQLDWDQLNAVINEKTRGIVICTPCNPSGKVFSRDELMRLGEIAKTNNLRVITDEIYEYITYPSYEHVSFASLEDFKNFTVTISGFSKTYNMTGWRLGYASAPAQIISKMALVQDLLYVCPATPLQHAALAAFSLQADYYQQMRASYLHKRDLVVEVLRNIGFTLTVPQGAYYLLADFSKLGFADDKEAAEQLLAHAKVATVTGRSFYLNHENGKNILRFCYALEEQKVITALNAIKNMFMRD